MVDLNPAALPTLGTLVTATVFSTTFVSGRLHRERTRALDRALDIDEDLVSASRSGSPEAQLEGASPALVREQWAVLLTVVNDKLSILLVITNFALALAVVFASVLFGSAAGLTLATTLRDPAGWALLFFGFVACLTATVGAIDVLLARRQLKRRSEETIIGETTRALRALKQCTKERLSTKRAERLAEARQHALQAVATSGVRVAVTRATLGYVDIVQHTVVSDENRKQAILHRAGQHLKSAIELGPATAPMWAAQSYVMERLVQKDAAVEAWLQAARLLARTRIPSEEIADADEGGNGEGTTLAFGPGADLLVGSDDIAAYGWFCQPSPIILAESLGRIPADDTRTVLISLLLVDRATQSEAGFGEDVLLQVARAIDSTLSRLSERPGGWIVAEGLARQIRRQAPIDSDLAKVAARHLDPTGPVYTSAKQSVDVLANAIGEMGRSLTNFATGQERIYEIGDAETRNRSHIDAEIDRLGSLLTQHTSDDPRPFHQAIFRLEMERSDPLLRARAEKEDRRVALLLEGKDVPDSPFEAIHDESAWKDWQEGQSKLKEEVAKLGQEVNELIATAAAPDGSDVASRKLLVTRGKALLLKAYELRSR